MTNKTKPPLLRESEMSVLGMISEQELKRENHEEKRIRIALSTINVWLSQNSRGNKRILLL